MKVIECIENSSSGWVRALDEIPPVLDTNSIGVRNKFWHYVTYYTDSGEVFGIEPNEIGTLKPSLLDRIIGLVHLKPLHIRMTPKLRGRFELSELKDRILRWIETDDDCYCIFVEVEVFAEEIASSLTFEDLHEVINLLTQKESA